MCRVARTVSKPCASECHLFVQLTKDLKRPEMPVFPEIQRAYSQCDRCAGWTRRSFDAGLGSCLRENQMASSRGIFGLKLHVTLGIHTQISLFLHQIQRRTGYILTNAAKEYVNDKVSGAQ